MDPQRKDPSGCVDEPAQLENGQPDQQATVSPEPDIEHEHDFPIVGVGASAGGLEALESFFAAMPADSGMAFVVVQHLSPDFRSLMDELLGRHTSMPIHRVEDGMAVRPNAVYLIPPRKEMVIESRRLRLIDKDPNKSLSLPIDTFFRSLAQDQGDLAIGIVLSGTGSDGSRGVRAIHEAGGLVLAQDDRSARFDGMPRAAIDTGVVDFILPPEDMPGVLLKHLNQPQLSRHKDKEGTRADRTAMSAIHRILRDEYGLDFSHYKPTTVARRIRRRLQMHRLYDVEEYVERLQSDADERNRLYRDLLIGVTRFFRDPEAFERIDREILPQLLAKIEKDDELRIWVAGCATGEEAYSFAMLVHEHCQRMECPVKAKIFATDVHRASLEIAGAGLYEGESLANVTPARLERYFVPKGKQFQVSPELRKLVVFAPHDVIRDAPFTKLDLVSCRNLLIYLEPAAQRRAISLFHFGLKTGGILLLGPSETPGELQGEFDTIDPHWRMYRKRRTLKLPPDIRLPLPAAGSRPPAAAAVANTTGDPWLLRAYDALLEHFVPPSLLINEQRRLIHTFAGAGKYLKLSDGRVTSDVLEMVSSELRMCLSAGMQRAAKDRTPIIYSGVQVQTTLGEERVRVTVRPIFVRDGAVTYFQVVIENAARVDEAADDSAPHDLDEASRERLRTLEEELQTTKENLQATIEELETSNEELQAANEELVAANEELQSTNEELHSVNEELYTVNAEHQRKIAELTQLTNDMDNLLRGTDVGTIFLDEELRIREFTPQITRAFQILPQDIGRRIDNFTNSIRYDKLLDDVQDVLRSEQRIEREVIDAHANHYLLRVLPYRTKERVEGVVLTLIDITVLRRAEVELRRMSKVFHDGTDPIVIEDLSGWIIDVNAEAERVYGYSRDELVGRRVTELIPAECREAEEQVRERIRRGEQVRNFESIRQAKDGAQIAVLLTFSVLGDEGGQPDAIATIAKDISERKRAEMETRLAVKRRDHFLAMLSHELRNPLAAVLNATQVISRSPHDPQLLSEARDVIERQTRQAARLLDDLLDVNRVTQGKIALRKTAVDLRRVVDDAIEAARPLIESRRHRLHRDLPIESLMVEGDSARLVQVVENLLTNAAKYTPPGRDIFISAQRKADRIVLEVRDTGVGIAADDLENIFGLFTQLETTLDRADGGLGVGLSLVRMLVEMHDGSVSAASEGAGRGSTFTVRLPARMQLDGDAPHEQSPSQHDGHPRSILIVEDIADSRQMLQRLLAFDGHTVRVAEDGHAGLRALLQDPPDVALVDVGLPGLDGYEVARIVRKNSALNHVRLIALTGYGRAEDRQAVLDAGFDEHLVKPVTPDELTRVLRLDNPAIASSASRQ